MWINVPQRSADVGTIPSSTTVWAITTVWAKVELWLDDTAEGLGLVSDIKYIV